jgi:hypothetical protein
LRRLWSGPPGEASPDGLTSWPPSRASLASRGRKYPYARHASLGLPRCPRGRILQSHLLIALLPVGERFVVQLGLQAVHERVGPGREAEGSLAVEAPVLEVERSPVPILRELPPDDGVFTGRELPTRRDPPFVLEDPGGSQVSILPVTCSREGPEMKSMPPPGARRWLPSSCTSLKAR